MEEPASSRAVRAVEEAARTAGLSIVVVEHAETTRTAVDAAAAVGCDVGQIVKSLVFSVRPAVGGAGKPSGDQGTGDEGTGDPGIGDPGIGDPGIAVAEPVLALVSGSNQLDERLLARAAGATGRARRVDAERVRAWTGFAIGGVPPFGHRRPLRCFVDRDLLRHDVVWAAAGTPHAVFAVPPHDLVRVADGLVADLRRP